MKLLKSNLNISKNTYLNSKVVFKVALFEKITLLVTKGLMSHTCK